MGSAVLDSFSRPDGSKQATLNGRPRYEFAPDSDGTTKGIGISEGGRIWSLATTGAGGATTPATSLKSASGSGFRC